MTVEMLVCPKCEGGGEYYPPLSAPDQSVVCPTCGGTGEVWPEPVETWP